MEFVKTYQGNLRPSVFLFSAPEAFSLYLIEKLLSNLCRVFVFSANSSEWGKYTEHITRTDNLVFDSQKNYTKYPKPDYFLIANLSDMSGVELIKKAVALSGALNSKGFVIVSENKFKAGDIELPETVGVISLNDLFGPRMELNGGDRMSQVIGGVISGETVKIYEGEKISPVYMGEAAKLIAKWLFSFGPYGEIASISSIKVGLGNICDIIKKVYPNFRYQVIRGNADVSYSGKKNVYLLERSDTKFLEETLLWFTRNTPPKKIVKKRSIKGRWALRALIAVLLFLAMPFAFIIFATSFLLFSREAAMRENFNLARFFVDSSYITSNIADGESRLLAGIPVLGRLYNPTKSISYSIRSASMVGSRGFDLIGETYLLFDNVLEGGDYDLGETQDKIISNLNYMETTLSFMEGEAKNYPNLYKWLNFSRLRELISNASKIATTLSDLLGVDKTKTYLVLFQNNMELRPTGGFIGSFALVSFSGGKLGEVSVQDVYSADGQLKGHIEPPQPIKKYLNEANWFLRDSNWDPDFPTSAERAEWFLDKEIDVPVDGVIALDLNVVKDLLQSVGPIYLSDYQTQISYDNFYEKTQAEAEHNFFAGSTRKASFITALAKEMISSLVLNKERSKADIAKIIYHNLEGRHIQIFLHNSLAKEAIADFNWDGAFNYQKCTGNCFSDFMGLVEANLGVNKSNYYVERKYSLSVNLGEGLIKKNLSVTYKNNADLAMGNSGIYKVYSRLAVPLNSEVDFVKIGDSELQPDIETVSGRKEVGFYFELPPSQTKTINISWQVTPQLSLGRGGEYLIYIRKQAGTSSEPISINFNTTSHVDLSVEPGYNTLFAKDIHSKVTWKK